MVISGKDRGVVGTVAHAYPRESRITVEGVNVKKKHQRAKGGTKGQVIEKPFPIHVSNVLRVDSKTGKGTRKRA